MLNRLTTRPVTTSALTLALLAMTACGGKTEGLLGQNKKSMRGTGQADLRDGQAADDVGTLSLTMPAGHAQFAGVTKIEIKVWSERYYRMPAPVIEPMIPEGRSSPEDAKMDERMGAPSHVRRKPVVRLLDYKAGEKANMSDIPSGDVTIRVTLLDAAGKAQFVGQGSSTVRKGQTAAATVYVSPTPGTGSVEIVIQPDADREPNPAVDGIPGGYSQIASDDARAKEAPAFAARQIKPTGNFTPKIVLASVQVVAGLYIAMTLDLVSGNQTEIYHVIVYKDLRGNMTLVKSQLLGASTRPFTGTGT